MDPAKLKEWQDEQLCLAKSLLFLPLDVASLRTVAGVDISFSPSSNSLFASLVILPYPPSTSAAPLYSDFYTSPMTEPYCAGYLAFRELPFLRTLFARLAQNLPDLYPPGVVLVDGNGIWHPRGLGSAAHLGAALDIPTIGVAKTFYHLPDVGVDDRVLRSLRDDEEEVKGTDGRVYGMAVRTGGSKKHVFVSCGHRCDLASAVAIVKACSTYRIPEPIRRADLESRRFIREKGL